MEKPILFSSEMVRAILHGRKTMTRRVMSGDLWIAPDGSRKCIDRRGIHPLSDACPYGKPGHALWVRETFAIHTIGGDEIVIYRADSCPDGHVVKWKPSIFMPRKYSRITLRVTGVRVERLQDISEAEILAEGVAFDPDISSWLKFASLWNQINEARGHGWDENPWVWVVAFAVEPTGDDNETTP